MQTHPGPNPVAGQGFGARIAARCRAPTDGAAGGPARADALEGESRGFAANELA